jgi:nucleoside-diphosphate-sugar epimerase
MRCLVTGASGFLGSHLTRELLEQQHEVVILLRPGSSTERLSDCLHRAHIVYGTLDELSGLEKQLRKAPVDAAFHLAWSGVTADCRDTVDQVIFSVTHSLNLWSILASTGCKFFLGLGSQAEYGLYSGPIREDLYPSPLTPYGSAKLSVGLLLQQLSAVRRMRFAWLRVFSTFGPGDDQRRMVPMLIRTLLARKFPRLTAGEQLWDYLYVEDAARAICATLHSDADGVFNLGSGTPCLLREFISTVRDCIDYTLPLGFGEVPYAENQVMHLLADITRLSAATGWRPKTSLVDGIRRTVEWHKQKEGATKPE